MSKENYLFHFDDITILEDMSDEEVGRIFRDVLRYATEGTEPEYDDRYLKNIFKVLARRHDADKRAYDERCKRNSENAKKRWGADASDSMQQDATACDCIRTDAKDANIDIDIDIDIDNDIDTDNDNDINNIYVCKKDIDTVPKNVKPVPTHIIHDIKERVAEQAELSSLALDSFITPAKIQQDDSHIYISMKQKQAVVHIRDSYGEYFEDAIRQLNPDFKGEVVYSVTAS